MSKIVDLDALAPEPKKVRLGGHVYTLPGDVPVELYLRINRFNQPDEDREEAEVVDALYGGLLDLFRVHQPDLEELPLGMGQLISAVGTIYGDAAEADEEAAAAARPTRRAGTASTKSRRTPAASRS